MKDVLGSLPEVITAYKNYNLLVPTATDVQLNPFYKFHVEEVPVNLGENSGDIFKVGSVKTGKQDEKGKDIWEDVFSLSKPLLNKMAMAAGIQFNPNFLKQIPFPALLVAVLILLPIYQEVLNYNGRSNGMIKILLSKKLGEMRLTQADLARATGIRPNTINELYHELADRVNLEHLDLICEALDCELDELIVRVPNKESAITHTRQGTQKPGRKR